MSADAATSSNIKAETKASSTLEEAGEPATRWTLGDLRRERGLTQAELAEEAGIAAVTVRKLEQGSAIPNLRTLQALQKVLGEAVFRCEYGSPSPLRPGRPRREAARITGSKISGSE